MSTVDGKSNKRWPDYRAVWRWHFYASLFCMPFVIILSITGGIYLFKPQLDRFADRQYDGLNFTGPVAPISAQVQAACDAFPGAVPAAYEIPVDPNDAGRVLLLSEGKRSRVFIHPVSLEVLGSRPDDGGFVKQVRSFHGQLGIGEKGSYIVELASSWTIVMILTGLFLWWPRQSQRFAGVLYPRLNKGTKVLLRDLHSVTGMWISALVLFLLATGLPWAKFWGGYLKSVREVAGITISAQDWSLGGVEKSAGDSHEGHKSVGTKGEGKRSKGSWRKREVEMPKDLTCFDRVAASVIPLNLQHPATIEPPSPGSTEWIAKSDTPNRPYRVTLKIDPSSGEMISREDFESRAFVDKMVAVGIAAHEGQLFGWPNQILGLFAAMGLILLTMSGYMMWWRRRESGSLGAPTPNEKPRFSLLLLTIVAALALYIPMFGASLLIVAIFDYLVIRRVPRLNRWLGLRNQSQPAT